MMDSAQRWKIKRGIDEFLDSIISAFPEENQEEVRDSLPRYPPDSLGTDGGLWTDAELTEYTKSAFAHSRNLMRRLIEWERKEGAG